MTPRDLPAAATTTRSRLHRWLLVAVGVVCVGLGALGVLVPGLPTTVFLIVASWCFARSCPWLEERLIRVPLFRPFLGYLDRGAGMPLRAVVVTLVVMWAAIATSCALLLLGDDPKPVVAAVVVAAGAVGSVFVVRLRSARASSLRLGGRSGIRPDGPAGNAVGGSPVPRRHRGRIATPAR